MGLFGDLIRNSTIANIITGRKNKAADLRVVTNDIASAVDYLEGRTRGAQILQGYASPAQGNIGLEGDAYVNTGNADFWVKHQFGWQLQFNLKGPAGKAAYQSWLDTGHQGTEADFIASLRGNNGKSAYQSWLSNGGVGNEAAFVEFMRGKTGSNGKSAYELWAAAGNVGTLADYLASMVGKDGHDGSRIRWESYAPTTEGGQLGDAWFYTVSASKVQMYEYIGPQLVASTPSDNGQTVAASYWRLRYTSPDAAAGTSPGNGGTANYPAQSAATANKFLKSSGAAGGESWDVQNRFGYKKKFVNLLVDEEMFFQATKVLQVRRDTAVATLSYSINGATAISIPFANSGLVYTPSVPIDLPAGSTVVWSITYANSSSVGYVEFFMSETLPAL